MKKTYLLLLFTLYLAGSAIAQEKEGINFRAITFDQAIQQAKAEKKPIFLHAFASWCHFCEFMVDSVYKDQEVAARGMANSTGLIGCGFGVSGWISIESLATSRMGFCRLSPP